MRGREAAFLARELGASPEQLYPFFAEAPVGRGYQKFDAGNVAARNVWLLLSHGVADRVHTSEALMAMLGDDSKHVRRNAAYVLGRVWLDGDMARFEHCFDSGDGEVKLGLLHSLRWLIGDAVMDHLEYSDISPHARVLRAGLAGTSKHRNEALDTVHQIAVRLRLSISPVLDALCRVLETGKPQQVETVINALSSHIYSIKHGRARWTDELTAAVDRLVVHAYPVPGNVKPTKVQIACRYALSALSHIEDVVPADRQRAIRQALAQVAKLR